jgi:hypothetical protein
MNEPFSRALRAIFGWMSEALPLLHEFLGPPAARLSSTVRFEPWRQVA